MLQLICSVLLGSARLTANSPDVTSHLCSYVQLRQCFGVQDDQSHGDSDWAAFDDLASQRSSRLTSDEAAQCSRPEATAISQSTEASARPSEDEGGWAAFASDPPAFGGDPPAFNAETSGRQSGHQSGTEADISAAWSAFDESNTAQKQSLPEGSVTGKQQSVDHQGPAMQSDDKPLPHADFGESNFWRTHPMALVDDVE